ncbi:unnamed protein product [Acanthosepion pharaonis]|uniref:Uncharacterized protein n=1 Tax=Acanthosepion pharaonis TaxID=158019 RepID=A0A812DPY7_ACAPH|nr:unnamed protein product [Sepia pharaonis]
MLTCLSPYLSIYLSIYLCNPASIYISITLKAWFDFNFFYAQLLLLLRPPCNSSRQGPNSSLCRLRLNSSRCRPGNSNFSLSGLQFFCLSGVFCLSGLPFFCLSGLQFFCLSGLQLFCLSGLQFFCLSGLQFFCLSCLQFFLPVWPAALLSIWPAILLPFFTPFSVSSCLNVAGPKWDPELAKYILHLTLFHFSITRRKRKFMTQPKRIG